MTTQVFERTARRTASGHLARAMAVLIAIDVFGGLLAIGTDHNSWGQAWNGDAILAAPWPMIAVQLLLTWLAIKAGRTVAAGASALLAIACGISAASGFFDGQLGKAGLGAGIVLAQYVLVAVTSWVAVVAAIRFAEVR